MPHPTDSESPDVFKASARFGTWPSPVTADLIAGATIRFGQIALRGSEILWSEGRPHEKGRNVVVQRRADGLEVDLNPAPYDARTRVHEYGGGAFLPLPDGGLVFSHFVDQQLYRIEPSGKLRQLTHDPSQRYADALHDPLRDRLIAVREDHREGAADAVATLVGIALATGAVEVLAQGHDFFASPALSPDGRRLAWLTWDHPDMPWDRSALWLAELAVDGGMTAPQRVAGEATESICQPAWSPDGALHFVSDRSGWWNLYRLQDGRPVALHAMAAEFARPQWVFGMSSYGFDASGSIVCAYGQEGMFRLATLDPRSGEFRPLETPYCAIDSLRVGADFAVFIGATPTRASAVVRLDLRTGDCEVLRESSGATLEAGFVSQAEAIAFPTEGGLTAHAFFYPPCHRDLRGPAGERPPLLVFSHGGPTSASDASFKWSHQYWTSRGFAVVDVNYGGSSGYGRAYRERLRGAWGVVDVDDCVNAARYLIARGDVHPERVAIRGGSAGGYTTLCALAFRQFFKAGAVHYGVGDLESLALDTHKFESRYLEGLVGPYPEARALYVARSPIHHTAGLASPMILFQGDQDKIVPPAQSQRMFDAVAAKGLPVAYVLFEGEQHGFRAGPAIKRALEAELYFYGKVFGFVPDDEIEPVPIHNLP